MTDLQFWASAALLCSSCLFVHIWTRPTKKKDTKEFVNQLGGWSGMFLLLGLQIARWVAIIAMFVIAWEAE